MRQRGPAPRWLELEVRAPVAVQEVVIDRIMACGSVGVQEEYPGVGFVGDAGRLLSGDPLEWDGAAIPNPADTVVLRAWFRAAGALSRQVRREVEAAIEGLLAGIGPVWRTVSSRDFDQEIRREWKAIPIGRRFWVRPAWSRATPPRGRVVLKLRPGMAFGTGTHFTTASCLEMVEEFLTAAANPSAIRVLDVGTGSGILAIGALLLGAREALGVDLDEDAVREARENARLNRVADRFQVRSERLTASLRPAFDLVLANLVAPSIVAMADILAGSVARGGRLVVSGILVEQARDIEDALQRRGLTRAAHLRNDTWVTSAWDNSATVARP